MTPLSSPVFYPFCGCTAFVSAISICAIQGLHTQTLLVDNYVYNRCFDALTPAKTFTHASFTCWNCADTRRGNDPNLPLEVDKAAPPMQSRMAHPTLEDINYVLNRWHYSWNRALEVAVSTQESNGHPDPERVYTPSRSIRAPTDIHLFGFPLRPSAPPRDTVFEAQM